VPDQRFPYPQILPVSGGGVQVEFQLGGRELELEFLANGALAILTVDTDGSMWEAELAAGCSTLYSQLLDWLNGR
jgi:hypothetical protein